MRMVIVKRNPGNPALAFWEYIRSQIAAPLELRALGDGGIEITTKRASELLTWCDTRPEFNDNPGRVQEALLFNAVRYRINEQGLAEIRKFLASYHKMASDELTRDELLAWGVDAAYELSQGKGATIYIPAADSVRGNRQTYTVTKTGLDREEAQANS